MTFFNNFQAIPHWILWYLRNMTTMNWLFESFIVPIGLILCQKMLTKTLMFSNLYKTGIWNTRMALQWLSISKSDFDFLGHFLKNTEFLPKSLKSGQYKKMIAFHYTNKISPIFNRGLFNVIFDRFLAFWTVILQTFSVPKFCQLC